ncbi:hypothetical protein ACIQCR_16795 [Streptomyces sp. NPDC093249]|uniref:hypothetical protein n=1 Tax=unclassified Streptomyces TaxID=2593676 RepID=UPI003819DAA0
MSTLLYMPTVTDLTATCGPLRTVLSSAGTVDTPPEAAEAYRTEIQDAPALRRSVIFSETGPALLIRLLTYRDPATGDRRFAVEKWSVGGYQTVDHAARIVCDAEYERQVHDEIAAPTLPATKRRLTAGGPATFYDATDVL